MQKELLDYIKTLSLEDPKNLQGKALKTASEAGDLAEQALAYTGAPGSMHTFVGKRAVLHEAVDTILCALSTAYDLGFSHEEIESMMVEQCAKWAEKQFKEQQVKDPNNIPYEIHITVKGVDREFFKSICSRLGIKPILLDLQTQDGVSILEDAQTSSVYFGTNAGALAEVERIVKGLKHYDIEVVREKIETVPWHPAAPSDKGIVKTMPKDCYFEVHFNVMLPLDGRFDAQLKLQDLAKRNHAHLSRNIFKKLKDGRETVMMTYRSYTGTREQFQEYVDDWALPDLKMCGFEVEKVITEFSIYDTKITHDAAWIGQHGSDAQARIGSA